MRPDTCRRAGVLLVVTAALAGVFPFAVFPDHQHVQFPGARIGQVAGDAGLFGDSGQADRGVAVDVEGELGVQVAHRVVGDRRQVHDGVATVQVGRLDGANVLVQVAIGGNHRLPPAPLEKADVATDDVVPPLLEQVHQMRADVSLVPGDEYLHGALR